jgi:hypothetical protein
MNRIQYSNVKKNLKLKKGADNKESLIFWANQELKDARNFKRLFIATIILGLPLSFLVIGIPLMFIGIPGYFIIHFGIVKEMHDFIVHIQEDTTLS